MPVRIQTILAEGRAGVRSRHAPARSGVPASPLRIGAATGALFGHQDDWLAANAPTIAPYGSQIHVIADAGVHSSAGIVILPSGEVIADTLDHTTEELDRYRFLPGGAVRIDASPRVLRGRFLSLLLGAYDNHFHLLLMNLARLAILDPAEKHDLAGVLVPDDLGPIGREALQLAGVTRTVPVRRGETIRVEELVLAWNVASSFGVNPDAATYLRALGARLPSNRSRRRIYVDRRGARLRPLLNEHDVVDTLAALDVEPVRFETMTLTKQITTMRSAELVIGPHGAGLTNIAFADPDTRIVELMPPKGANWCYRYLAASGGQPYDCVWGREVSGSDNGWMVSPAHAASAVTSSS